MTKYFKMTWRNSIIAKMGVKATSQIAVGILPGGGAAPGLWVTDQYTGAKRGQNPLMKLWLL